MKPILVDVSLAFSVEAENDDDARGTVSAWLDRNFADGATVTLDDGTSLTLTDDSIAVIGNG